jgi:signal transduction histidine kinase
VSVSRLALENARLQTTLQARLLEVQQARSRLMHTGLEQRRRLERDLHDGAQQRLLAIGLQLGVLESGCPDAELGRAIAATRVELQRALEELRDLAHGLYPAVLSQAGVAAAMEAVVERLPIPVTLDITSQRWPRDVEGAAYLVACEALVNAVKHAQASVIALNICQQLDQVVIAVSDDGRGFDPSERPEALRSVRDRVDALGGSLSVLSRRGEGCTVRAELPCR